MGVLIQLPLPQMQDALKICPELRALLLEYASEISEHQIGHVSQQIMELLLGPGAPKYQHQQPDVIFINPEQEAPMAFPIQIKQELEIPPTQENLPPGTF